MKAFHTKPGVNSFETGGPEGLITITADKPLQTDDPAIISILAEHGAHALDSEDVSPAGGATKAPAQAEKSKDGDRS